MVRALQFPTVRALAIAVRRQRVVRPALAAPRFGYLLVGDSHDFRFPDPMEGASQERFLAKFRPCGKPTRKAPASESNEAVTARA